MTTDLEVSEYAGAAGELMTSEIVSHDDLDIQIRTAKSYPRSIRNFKATATELACLDEDTAAECFYVLRRGSKQIEGPSIRFAEIVGYAWTNLRYEARVVEVSEKFIVAQATAFDLERNVAARGESRRRITDKQGRRYNDDMIVVTSNAACSIALREAIFKVVPRSMFKDILAQCKLTAIGKASSMSERRHKAVEWFTKAGATDAEIFAYLGRASIDEITADDLIALRGLVTAIKDGDTTIEEALSVSKPEPKKKVSVVKKEEPPDRMAETLHAMSPDERLKTLRSALAECKTKAEVTDCYTRWVDWLPEQTDDIDQACTQRHGELK